MENPMPNSPSNRQLRYLRLLAQHTATTFITPRTSREASREINRLLRLRRTDHVPFYREPSITTDPRVYGTAPRPSEIVGYGSTAHWRTTAQRDPEKLPETQPRRATH
jgi:hypothetical protein